jgi:hypothetical protein
VALGARIRARRLALGQSLDEVARATKIPVAHLEALEDERPHDLPPGPYAAAYTRAVVRHLGLDADSSEEDDGQRVVGASSAGAPLWLVRTMAIVSLVALLAVVGSATWERFRPVVTAPPQAAEADQKLVIEARRSTRLKVAVDGGEAEEKAVAGGDRLELAARERLEVDLQAIGDVRLEWNGEAVVPQGRQDAPRRLVFVDDAGGAW